MLRTLACSTLLLTLSPSLSFSRTLTGAGQTPPPAAAADGKETVTVLLGDGPYFSGLYHRNGCWWTNRGSRPQTMSRADAEKNYYQPHHECVSKPERANSTAPPNAPRGDAVGPYEGKTPEEREVVGVRLSTPYLNGLYHRVGCWWLTRAGLGEMRSMQRADADRRYFRPHHECMNKPPNGNAQVPKGFEERAPANSTTAVRGAVDLAHFGRIQIGMTLSEVEKILGAYGDQTSQMQLTDTKYESWSWQSGDFAFVTVSFKNGRVMSKQQIGLK